LVLGKKKKRRERNNISFPPRINSSVFSISFLVVFHSGDPVAFRTTLYGFAARQIERFNSLAMQTAFLSHKFSPSYPLQKPPPEVREDGSLFTEAPQPLPVLETPRFFEPLVSSSIFLPHFGQILSTNSVPQSGHFFSSLMVNLLSLRFI